jgi:dolichol-phosphate mannosyltransferase
MKVSIVIPFFNEEENVDAVLDETRRANPDAEIIAVNDGSQDGTLAKLNRRRDVRVISFRRNLGQSAALYTGLTQACGEVCVMMDGDGQSDPADIPKLVAMLDQADIVCGYRLRRQDVWSRRAASWVANFVRRLILRDGIRDTGCTLKAMRTGDARHLVPFNGLHRFLPAFFKQAGLRIVEVPVNHRPRRFGKSKYTARERIFRGIYDLIGVRWLLARKITWPKPAGTSPVANPNGHELAKLNGQPVESSSRKTDSISS